MIVKPQGIRSIAMLSMTLLLLVPISCGAVPEQTDPAGYVHYVPRPGSLFEIEFDYPAAWYLAGDEVDILAGTLFAELASARPTPIPTLPSGAQAFIEPVIGSEAGIVTLYVKEVDPATFSLKERVQPYVEDIKQLRGSVTLESSRATQIDGYPAHRVSTVWPPAMLGMITTQRRERVFLVAGSRYYEISLQTPEHLRDGPFVKGFEHLLSSVRVKR